MSSCLKRGIRKEAKSFADDSCKNPFVMLNSGTCSSLLHKHMAQKPKLLSCFEIRATERAPSGSSIFH